VNKNYLRDAFEAWLISKKLRKYWTPEYKVYKGLSKPGFSAKRMKIIAPRPVYWRIDWALVDHKIAVELEGGIWMAGKGHVNGKTYKDNCDKYNKLTSEGWQVIRFTADHVKSSDYAPLLRLLESRDLLERK